MCGLRPHHALNTPTSRRPSTEIHLPGNTVTLATFISLSDFADLVETALTPDAPTVRSSESELGEPLQHFGDAAAILDKAAQCLAEGRHHYAFGFWYPAMKGNVLERRIDLDPPREGKSHRYSLSGWGLIHLHVYCSDPRQLQCRVVVNSLSRAMSRESRYPELGPVADWDWKAVERLAYKLTSRLSTMGVTGPVVQPTG